MGARFVIGRAGTGKTRRCFDEIVRMLREAPLGPPIYWLLPRQATFTAERMLTCGSGLPAFCRARVLSFQEFGREILAECGGVAIPQVTAVGRQMILGHLLRMHRSELKFFQSVAHHAGLAANLDATFAELERSGKSPDDLKTIVPDLADESLAAKLADLIFLYDKYSKYLGQDRLDPHKRLQEVLKCIEQSKLVRSATLFVDGFYEFTDYERRFLAGVAKSANRVEVSLTLDPNSAVLRDPQAHSDEIGMFNLAETTYRRLHAAFVEADVEIAEPFIARKVERFISPALTHLERCLFLSSKNATTETAGVEMIEAPDRRGEVDAAARQIQTWIGRDNLRLRDIAVLVRDMDAYHELIDASFREHGLPWFVDRRRSATHHPLIQFTRALPALALHDFDHDAVMTILKSGLTSITPDEADELENFILLHRIHGVAWSDASKWKLEARKLTREASDDEPAAAGFADQTDRMIALRAKLIDPLTPFLHLLNQARSTLVAVEQLVSGLLEAIEACAIPRTLSRWIEEEGKRGRLEHQAEHARVWDELLSLLEQMRELLGAEPVTSADFVEILESALETFDLALTPPTVDQVLVGSVDRTRTPPDLRAVIVMGLHEGGFPWCAKENQILGDGERRELQKCSIVVDPDTQRRLLDERFLAYVAFTRASEKLCVMRPLADDEGRPFAPSPFWRMLREIFPRINPTTLRREVDQAADCIGTPRQLVTSLLRWARADAPASDPIWPALYDRFAAHDCDLRSTDAIDAMRCRAWRALSYENAAQLSPEISSRLFSNPLRASVSRIETFANCPFKHFARYGLKLQSRDEEDVTVMDLGNAYHGILENLVREMIAKRQDFTTATQKFTDEQIKHFAKQVGEKLRHEVLLSNARNQYLLHRIERTLTQVIDSQREVARRGKFRPWKTELSFGDGGNDRGGVSDSLPPLVLKTPAGKRVELRGKIDRVDLIEEQAAVAVIDYKLSGNSLKLDSVYHGLSLQLLTYLLVLQNSAPALGKTKLAPAAAFYVKLLRKLDPVKHPDEALSPDGPEFHLKDKPRGIFDQRFLSSLDSSLTTGSSNVIQALVKKDGGLGKASDGLDSATFAMLLKFVERRITEIADQILAGQIAVAPYISGTTTPCPNCEFRSVCRFDRGVQSYRKLEAMKKETVIERATQALRGEGKSRD